MSKSPKSSRIWLLLACVSLVAGASAAVTLLYRQKDVAGGLVGVGALFLFCLFLAVALPFEENPQPPTS
jgi:hypothetical protein